MYITVVPYDPLWKVTYAVEAEQLKEILIEVLVGMHHIGSTAVEGLCAKPVIDIMAVVKNIDSVDCYNHGFAAIGYECMGEYGMSGRRYFRKGAKKRTHHVHVFEAGNLFDTTRHLAVRDYLRAHPQVALEYGRLKIGLAAKFPRDVDGYCDGKDAFVKQLELAALKWYSASKIAKNIRQGEDNCQNYCGRSD